MLIRCPERLKPALLMPAAEHQVPGHMPGAPQACSGAPVGAPPRGNRAPGAPPELLRPLEPRRSAAVRISSVLSGMPSCTKERRASLPSSSNLQHRPISTDHAAHTVQHTRCSTHGAAWSVALEGSGLRADGSGWAGWHGVLSAQYERLGRE
jgi:hypothetical protein